ncbi:tyrosine--tRNA ligase [Sediminibacterium sp.]|uniref:tyrosine--tRNA ligase n=1 Tax=Sediminibacterium sp. TaxID=1917865 RepID=UPI002716DE3C|nr:tyrosine--tRNA ligase [Sediminibacterium sp.]MDO9000452.1 tyrosine--tRNA ligase [Bacteroidota bacterium]MDP3146980.1 tyrosine--tRNA ligase [Bacteroidota bacterium]MDP3567482.1 tyrosine--tRNA ligase [Sediminibacterium sp.]
MKTTNFVDELRWRGLLQDMMPGTEELLNKETVSAYIGFDPTADSLHIGSLTQIFTLIRFQKAGHKPIALIGGATGMVGDPSGKSAERNLLNEEDLNKNVAGIKKQLEKFLDFDSSENNAELVNNYDWMKNYSFINFIRDIGKHLTVSYMMAKDSVKNRLESGMSFTEFSYQLLQAYDFYYLHKNNNCKLQMGGSDQWGNITSGTELIRRKASSEAFGLTTQLIKKADGTKFGKTEGGNIWLDKTKTSPYKFYQFWINTSDVDAKNFIKVFTFLPKEEVENLISEHDKDPGKRVLQKALAKELTCHVHSEADYNAAIETSTVLFNGELKDLSALDEATFLDVFDGVPQFNISKSELESSINVLEFLSEKTQVLPSKSEARKLIQGGGISINKEKVETHELILNPSFLINNKYILIQKGKKNYFLCTVN